MQLDSRNLASFQLPLGQSKKLDLKKLHTLSSMQPTNEGITVLIEGKRDLER
jgi:hypothetical protein